MMVDYDAVHLVRSHMSCRETEPWSPRASHDRTVSPDRSTILDDLIAAIDHTISESLHSGPYDSAAGGSLDTSESYGSPHHRQAHNAEPAHTETQSAELISAAMQRLSFGSPLPTYSSPSAHLQRRGAVRSALHSTIGARRASGKTPPSLVVDDAIVGASDVNRWSFAREAEAGPIIAGPSGSRLLPGHGRSDDRSPAAPRTPRKVSTSSSSTSSTPSLCSSRSSSCCSSSCSRLTTIDPAGDHHQEGAGPLCSVAAPVGTRTSCAKVGYTEDDIVPLYASPSAGFESYQTETTPATPPRSPPPPSVWSPNTPRSPVPRAKELRDRLSDQFLAIRKGGYQHRRVSSASDPVPVGSSRSGLEDWTTIALPTNNVRRYSLGQASDRNCIPADDRWLIAGDIDDMGRSEAKRRGAKQRREAIRQALEEDDARISGLPDPR